MSLSPALALNPDTSALLKVETAKLDSPKTEAITPQANQENNVAPDLSKRQLLQLAFTEYKAGKLEDAAVLYRTVLTFDKNNVDAYYNLGVIAEQQGKYRDAEAAYRQALFLKPDDNEIKQAIASVQGKLSNGPEYSRHAESLASVAPLGSTSSFTDNTASLPSNSTSVPYGSSIPSTSDDQSITSHHKSHHKHKSSGGGGSGHLLSGIVKFSLGATAKAGVEGVRIVTF